MPGLIEPKVVFKQWGYERWIANGDYCGKELFFIAGRKCSLHYHKVKDETFFVQRGTFLIRTCPYKEGQPPSWHAAVASQQMLRPGNCFHVAPLTVHQMESLEDGTLIEVSTHHDDEDSIRLETGS